MLRTDSREKKRQRRIAKRDRASNKKALLLAIEARATRETGWHPSSRRTDQKPLPAPLETR